MTSLALPYGLIATLEEADTDRPAPPPLGVHASHANEHLWLSCPCPTCAQRRRAVGLAEPKAAV